MRSREGGSALTPREKPTARQSHPSRLAKERPSAGQPVFVIGHTDRKLLIARPHVLSAARVNSSRDQEACAYAGTNTWIWIAGSISHEGRFVIHPQG